MDITIRFESEDKFIEMFTQNTQFAIMIVDRILSSPKYLKLMVTNQDFVDHVRENKCELINKMSLYSYANYNNVFYDEFQMIIELFDLFNDIISRSRFIMKVLMDGTSILSAHESIILELINMGLDFKYNITEQSVCLYNYMCARLDLETLKSYLETYPDTVNIVKQYNYYNHNPICDAARGNKDPNVLRYLLTTEFANMKLPLSNCVTYMDTTRSDVVFKILIYEYPNIEFAYVKKDIYTVICYFFRSNSELTTDDFDAFLRRFEYNISADDTQFLITIFSLLNVDILEYVLNKDIFDINMLIDGESILNYINDENCDNFENHLECVKLLFTRGKLRLTKKNISDIGVFDDELYEMLVPMCTNKKMKHELEFIYEDYKKSFDDYEEDNHESDDDNHESDDD